MLSYPDRKSLCVLATFLLAPFFVHAGDPIPGIDITVDQSTSGIKASGTTNDDGELILSGFKPGKCMVTLFMDGKAVTIGNGKSQIITLPPSKSQAPIKPIRLELARTTADKKASSPGARQMANHNTTRSNKTVPAALDDDDDGDSIPTMRANNHNTTRSNRLTPKNAETSGDGAGKPSAHHNVTRSNKLAPPVNDHDDDCDGIVEITPMKDGRIKIKVSCS